MKSIDVTPFSNVVLHHRGTIAKIAHRPSLSTMPAEARTSRPGVVELMPRMLANRPAGKAARSPPAVSSPSNADGRQVRRDPSRIP
jgi:hypothetical protein